LSICQFADEMMGEDCKIGKVLLFWLLIWQ